MKSAFSWQWMPYRDDRTSSRSKRTSLNLGQLTKLQKAKYSVIDLTDLLLDFFEVWLFLTMWGKKNKMVIPARFSHNYCAMQCFSTFLCELDKNQLFIQHELHSYYPNLLTQANMEQIIISFKTLSLEVNSYHGFIEDTSST